VRESIASDLVFESKFEFHDTTPTGIIQIAALVPASSERETGGN
jgi:hypothetical protein